jgi:hypothetical protein
MMHDMMHDALHGVLFFYLFAFAPPRQGGLDDTKQRMSSMAAVMRPHEQMKHRDALRLRRRRYSQWAFCFSCLKLSAFLTKPDCHDDECPEHGSKHARTQVNRK